MNTDQTPSIEADIDNLQEVMDNASSLFDIHEKKILDLKNLLRISGLINSTLNMKEMNTALLFSCQGTILASTISIFLTDSIIDESFALKASVGLENENLEIEFKEDTLLIKVLSQKVSSLTIESIKDNPDYLTTIEKLAPLEPILVVPMKNKDRLTGFMVFGAKLNQEPYTNSEIDFLTNVANFASIAAENIRLFEMATKDRMTNLYVHHYFQNRLEEETVRALRYNAPLALIMFDIDHFKMVNDTHGHQAGDVVIKEIAALIRQNLRKIDLPARYGGEEFAIILPESDKEQARQVAERVRQNVQNNVFHINDELQIKITVSAGVADLNLEAGAEQNLHLQDAQKLKEDLIRRADVALYDSKQKGRNKVSLYGMM